MSKLNLNPIVRVQRLISSSKGGFHPPASPVAHTEPFCRSADDVQMFGLDDNDSQEECTPAFQTWWRDMAQKRALLDKSSVDKRAAIAETAGHLAQSDPNTRKLLPNEYRVVFFNSFWAGESYTFRYEKGKATSWVREGCIYNIVRPPLPISKGRFCLAKDDLDRYKCIRADVNPRGC